MTNLKRPVLIIKTGHTIDSLRTQGEDFEDWFARGLRAQAPLDNVEVIVVQGHLQEPLPDLAHISGLIITGSPAYITDLESWNYPIAEYARRAHEAGIPQLGICYGHQLIAWAFGGEVGFHPAGREIGTVPITLEQAAGNDALFSHLPERFKVQASHQQSVLQLPQDALLLGGNAFDPNHCFRIGDFTWCAQFHPEFDARITRAYISERRSDIAAEGLNPEQLLAAVEETPESASLLWRFSEIVAQREAQRL